VSQLAQKIAAEIQNQGAIPFARFMELALYCPVYGYYEKEGDTVGRGGDFYTSVSVGSLFGELLAFQFAQWLIGGRGNQSKHKWIAETGAHKGTLSRDILRWIRAWCPSLYDELQYWIIEPSERRQAWQQSLCSEFGSRIHWARDLQSWTAMKSAGTETGPGEYGICFSNELLDSFPVHRFGWDAIQRCWFEWGITLAGDRFAWARLPNEQSAAIRSQAAIASVLRSYELSAGTALPDGFIVEISLKAIQWWTQAAGLLSAGKLITIDYGFEQDELLRSGLNQGTLRSYRSHRPGASPLEDPGEQDITAHVNFSMIREAGENSGLRTHALLTQAQFLTPIAAQTWNAGVPFDAWNSDRKRQFQTLTHPEHLGRAFRVLIQSRACS
jgi:SAM-dependent MidA family methyltransferase